MNDSLCSCCQIFGEPQARVNFIIVAGGPSSITYQRINCLLQKYSETNLSTSDNSLTNYDTLMAINSRIYDLRNEALSADSCTKNLINKCCYGYLHFPFTIDGESNMNQWEPLRQKLLDLLDANMDANLDEEQMKAKLRPSWILLYGSICLEPALLNIFIQLKDQNTPLLTNTFAVLGLLLNEQKLFENSICHGIILEEYKNIIYPQYERCTRNFFSQLNSSPYLQEHTLLVEESKDLTNNELTEILKHLFQQKISKYSSVNSVLRSSMEKLLKPRARTVRDIRTIRSSLQTSYQKDAKDPLESMVIRLKHPDTAAQAAREVIHLVLNEFSYISKEQRRAYQRQLLCGFDESDSQNSNTIAAQMVHYALQLLQNYDDLIIPLLYAVIVVICEVSKHFYFRHELFNHTQETFTLSLLLVSHQHYALVIAGLQLCTRILNADQNEHKYARIYLSCDSSAARKIIKAIKWLLSPYQQLKKLWDEKKEIDSDSDNDKSLSLTATQYCCQHTQILFERVNLGILASLFYGCFDHCLQVTEDDVYQIVDAVEVLANPNFTVPNQDLHRSRISLSFVLDLCAFLTPILLNGSRPISFALTNETRLLMIIPTTIANLLKIGFHDMDKINRALRFYNQLIQSKAKYGETNINNSNDKQDTEKTSAITTESVTAPVKSLCLTKDLLLSYYTLRQQFQTSILCNETAAQQEQLQILFETEWKKIDTLQLKYDSEQLKQKNQYLDEKLENLGEELKRTQSERDQYRRENIRMAQENDRLKLATLTNVISKSEQAPKSVSDEKDISDQTDIVDELRDLLPHQITTEKAKQFIDEIYRRRTTFKDEDMRKSICGSLKHLGSDLYSSSVHFLYELIQNAEDNVYVSETSPYLRVELNHDYILLSNNEQGLRARDVLAICSLAVSTKTSEQNHIGEKGVGFKSVFAASNQPMLISHSWKFRFQVPGSDAMSYITPLWVHDEDIPPCILNQISTNRQHTHLYLPLKLTAHTPLAKQFLNEVSKAVDPCILLNMRQLKKLEIYDQRENKLMCIEKEIIGSTKLERQASVMFEDFIFINLNASMNQLCTPTGYRTFRVYNCQIEVPSTIEQRRNPTTLLTLAFPCESDYDLNATVYTGLPVCDLGFNFMFNAEFHLVTSRESVRENVPFNTYLRDHLAVLFVYLLLNDSDLKKDISRYCPSSNIHQVKHSSWWLSMIDCINQLITKHLSVLFDIRTGKAIRYLNPDLACLISQEQLYKYANIQVIDSNDEFFTVERLKSFQIQTVSIKDILECFPNQDDQNNEFQVWAQNNDERWWSQLFYYLSEGMTSEISNLILKKPIFLLQDNHQRQYLPKTTENSLCLYINNDPSIRIWKRKLTLLRYMSSPEKTALYRSNQVQTLTEQVLIDIIQNDHLQLSLSSNMTSVNNDLLEEVWKDLSYLHTHMDKLDKSKPILVPAQRSSCLALIQNTTLPTIFGLNIRSFIDSSAVTFVHFPYFSIDPNPLINHLQWEYFLLKMHCKPPSINLPHNFTIDRLPLLPLFTMFTDEKSVRLGEFILSVQPENTQQSLRQFPVVVQVNSEEQIRPISTIFDQSIILDFSSLPQINIPSYCRSLAEKMGVCTEYDLITCMTILQHLSDEKITNVDLYIEWLGRLQLEVRQKNKIIDNESFHSTCRLYLPDQDEFCSLKNLLVMSDINDQHRQGILLVCKYLKLQLVSSTTNHTYWQFKNLFRILGCQSTVTIENIYQTILLASNDEHNFYPLGNHLTTLTDSGKEKLITLFQYLEESIVKCVGDSATDTELYRVVITERNPIAPCGSEQDLRWRFALTLKMISSELKKIIDIPILNTPLPLLTIDRQLVTKKSTNIIYACFETKIIQNLSRALGKRHFISPVITRTCPLILALCEIDYVERRGKIRWNHQNINLENYLTQLSTTFQETTGDCELEVVTLKYANINLIISDSVDNEMNDAYGSDSYLMESDYPFWILNKTVLLCIGNAQDDSSRAIVATSALATLLYKRHYVPFEEAKLIARQKILNCHEFGSRLLSRFASTGSEDYSYLDVIFPTDHESIELMIISIGQNCTIEQDPEEIFISPEWSGVDHIYRNRAEQQNHRDQSQRTPSNWMNPAIVDGEEHIRVGQSAEYFFFTYLQKLYGKIDVTPIKNWRSSARSKIYPQYTRNINDSLGYDIELQDTKELFVRGTKSTTKKCYFEVKGTSGSFHEEQTYFHISRNEQEKCESIAFDSRKQEREAYLIVIIEHCLDPEKIALAKVFDWSSNYNSISLDIESYRCSFFSTSSGHTTQNNNEQPYNFLDNSASHPVQQWPPQYQPEQQWWPQYRPEQQWWPQYQPEQQWWPQYQSEQQWWPQYQPEQ